MTLDSRVHAGGGGGGGGGGSKWGGGARSKSSSKYYMYLLSMVFLSKSYMKAFILGALGTQ